MPEIGFWPYRPDAADLIAEARRFEDRGIRSIWTGESQDSLVTAAAMAGVLRHATIGTAISLLVRPPALLVESLVTLHQLTGGRFQLGLGLVQRHRMEGWYGLPWNGRASRLIDYVRAVRSLFTALPGQPASYHGDYYSIDQFVNWRNEPLPPPPPIWIAASGPQMLRAAGTVGDGVLLTKLMSLPYFEQEGRALVTAGARDAGRDATIRVAMVRAVAVDADRDAARDRVRGAIADAAARDYHRDLLARSGFEREVAAIQAAAGNRQAAKAAVTDAMVDALALAGTPDDLRQQVARYAGSVDVLLIEPVSGLANWDAANAQALAIAEALTPSPAEQR